MARPGLGLRAMELIHTGHVRLQENQVGSRRRPLLLAGRPPRADDSEAVLSLGVRHEEDPLPCGPADRDSRGRGTDRLSEDTAVSAVR